MTGQINGLFNFHRSSSIMFFSVFLFINTDGQRFYNAISPCFFIRYLKDNQNQVLQIARIDYIGSPNSPNYKTTDKIVLTEEIKWTELHFFKVLYFDKLEVNNEKMF